jgi:hypothetical protein
MTPCVLCSQYVSQKLQDSSIGVLAGTLFTERGTILTAFIVCYALTSVVAGYVRCDAILSLMLQWNPSANHTPIFHQRSDSSSHA